MVERNIQQIINGVQYAATSATGDAVIYIIYNYYDANDIALRVKPSDTNLDEIDTPSPYLGLSYFKSSDAQLFFGRCSQIKELEKATEVHNFIPILGASGSGKSSLVFAGLIPKLAEKGSWLFTYFRLGDNPNPFEAIAQALLPLYGDYEGDLAKELKENKQKIAEVFASIQNKHPEQQLLLFADQFEQLYAAYDEATQHLFLDLLLNIIQPPSNDSLPRVLVTTMRAEFLGKALSYQPFADSFKRDIKLLSLMKPQELAEVIEKPAGERNVEFQEGLVSRILDHVSNDENCLPLLEFALDELWKKRTERLKKAGQKQEKTEGRLTYADYQEIGEVKGSIEKYANNFYRDLTSADKEQVPKIFIQLVNFSQFTQDRADRLYVRRVTKKTEFREEDWRLVQVLADKRLVVTNRNADGEDTVEIIHEALIQEWRLLREWIDNDRTFLTWRHQLRIDIERWKSANNDEGALLRGKPLVIAEDWLQKREADLKNEREYIDQSLAMRKQEQEKQKRRRQFTIFGLTSFSLVALSLAGFAGLQWQQAEIRQSELRINYSNTLFQGEQHFDALMEALRVAAPLRSKPDPPKEVVGVLLQAVYGVKERNRLQGHSDSVKSVSFSPDGKTLASGSGDSTIKLWDVATGKEITTLKGHSDLVKSVSFSPDGKTLASSGDDNTIKLWDVATRKEITTLKGHSSYVKSVSFSPDGKILASGSSDETIKLWNVATRKEITTLKGHGKGLEYGSVFSVSFSPDGNTLASGSWDGIIKIWNVKTGKEITTFKGHNDVLYSVSFSPNGKTLASSSSEHDHTIKLWDIATKKEITTLKGHDNGFVFSVSFSPDGKTLASGSNDHTIKIWNVNTGKEITTLKGHSSKVDSVSFSPDGKTLASGSEDNTIKLWDVATSKEIITIRGHSSYVNSVSFSPNSKILASGSLDNTIKLWNISTGKEITTFKEDGYTVNSVNFSPDGKTLASDSGDKTVILWNLNFEDLLLRGCNWVRPYLQNSPNVSESDKHLCDGI